MLARSTWWLLGVIAAAAALAMALGLLHGGLGHVLRAPDGATSPPAVPRLPRQRPPRRLAALPGSTAARSRVPLPTELRSGLSGAAKSLAAAGVALALALAFLAVLRARARAGRTYVRMRAAPYRTDRATAEAVVSMFESLHKCISGPWWERLVAGQPSLGLEIHHSGVRQGAWFAVTCPTARVDSVLSSLRGAYPNCRLSDPVSRPGFAPCVLRLKKHATFIRRSKLIDIFEHDREPAVERLLTAMAAAGGHVFLQIALTPAPSAFESYAKTLFRMRENEGTQEGASRAGRRRSMVEQAELTGALDLQHRPLFFADLRVVAGDIHACRRVAAELRSQEAENRLVERTTGLRHGLMGLYRRRIQRGEGNPIPSFMRNVFASTELAQLWHLPSPAYSIIPIARASLPVAPAPPAIMRPRIGVLRDELGPVSIHPSMRRQNVAVPGAVEQGKSSFLVASFAEDLRRERCAVILLDPKGDAADAALSIVPTDRTCTLLDFAGPTCGFNPLAVEAPADVIADYVVGALRNLFDDGDIRASSDRYLRNAIIAVLAHDRGASLWDAARLLSVGEEGYAYRARVAAHVRTMPEFKEVSGFFTAELSAQLADSRSTTTAKLDAPVNKLARLLNSPSIKRILLNDSLTVDFDGVIGGGEVLIVKGALGAMGAGNTSVLMQLLVGMLDAALARQQDMVPAEDRVAVALKVDEAPLALNRGFAQTMALKRSAGLETVACWQTDAQWTDREIRAQLDALFAHRVHFATASVEDARASAELMMSEFRDSVRAADRTISVLARPDARLHLPKHHAIVSWATPEGRQPPFVASTLPMGLDPERIATHAEIQAARGGRPRTDLRQPHWDAKRRPDPSPPAGPMATAPTEEPPAGAQEVPPPAAARAWSADGDRSKPAQPRAADPPAPPPAEAEQATPPLAPAPLPEAPAPSYAELIDLDGAVSVRWPRSTATAKAVDPDRSDLEMLALVASLGHVLATQLHRRFNPDRSPTTTGRRLKRLADAGLLERFQLHRPDGGGVPMCCAITRAGLDLLHRHDLCPSLRQEDLEEADQAPPGVRTGRSRPERRLLRARREVHLAAWILAFERTIEPRPRELAIRGRHESVLVPPLRSTGQGRQAIGPADLRLSGGLVPHGFLRSDPSGHRSEVERFETVRPDATLELTLPTLAADLILEMDHRPARGSGVAKLERYDHFLSGWSRHQGRYATRLESPPLLVLICRDRARARESARAADQVLGACLAYAGEYPSHWRYPGRELTVFVAERDVHEGMLQGYGLPRLPPDVRAQTEDSRARSPELQLREILPAEALARA